MNKTTVSVRGSEIVLPAELWRAVDRPALIRVVRNESQGMYFVAAGTVQRAKALLKRMLQLGDSTSWYGRTRADEDFVWFDLRRGVSVSQSKDEEFRIVNYGRSVHLLPFADEDEAVSRQTEWASYVGYHEHLPYDQQKSRAVRISQWLAKVFSQFKPESALELGCGSGRNLYYLQRANPDCKIHGIELNPHAVAEARRQLMTAAEVTEGSLYHMSGWPDNSVDVVFTSGVLEHVPAGRIDDVVRQMHRIARIVVINFELHGPSHSFDYHRYPRDYRSLYERLNLGTDVSYRVFPRNDFRSRTTGSFRYALLVSVKRCPSE